MCFSMYSAKLGGAKTVLPKTIGKRNVFVKVSSLEDNKVKN